MAIAAPKVLVVDDDATVREVVMRYLLREGYRVEESSDGADALERALADPPELVVLDLMLPSLDGLEVCRQLRLSAPVPVIMLTARDEEGDRVAGLELGADDYVAKPFSPRELTARVKAVLRRTSGPLAPAPRERGRARRGRGESRHRSALRELCAANPSRSRCASTSSSCI